MLKSVSTSQQSIAAPGGLEETAAGDPRLSFAEDDRTPLAEAQALSSSSGR